MSNRGKHASQADRNRRPYSSLSNPIVTTAAVTIAYGAVAKVMYFLYGPEQWLMKTNIAVGAIVFLAVVAIVIYNVHLEFFSRSEKYVDVITTSITLMGDKPKDGSPEAFVELSAAEQTGVSPKLICKIAIA